MNPYTHQVFLYVPNSERAALGQFFRDHGDDLAGFANGEDIEMVGASTDGKGPPDGWYFASWVTQAQALAFGQNSNWPTGTRIAAHPVGQGDHITWLASFGMQPLDPEDV